MWQNKGAKKYSNIPGQNHSLKYQYGCMISLEQLKAINCIKNMDKTSDRI